MFSIWKVDKMSISNAYKSAAPLCKRELKELDHRGNVEWYDNWIGESWPYKIADMKERYSDPLKEPKD